MEPSLLDYVQDSFVNSDIVAILVDVSNKLQREKLDSQILNLLRTNRDKESILVINKIDKLKDKRSLLEITSILTSGIVGNFPIYKSKQTSLLSELKSGNFESLFKRTENYLNYNDSTKDEDIDLNEDNTGWPNFSQVFMISALENDGIGELRSYLLNKAQYRPWLYSENAVTTEKPKSLIIDALREVCLELFHKEIPYNLFFQIVMWEVDDSDNMFIVVDLHCPAKFTTLIIGPKGSTISKIVRKSKEVLCNIFHCDVSLKIAIKPNNNKNKK